MSIASVVLKLESMFTVHHEIGYAKPYRDSNGEIVGDWTHRDMERAPCGDKYITFTSHGIEGEEEPRMFFVRESTALGYWQSQVEKFAENVAPMSEWNRLHLYWGAKPVFHKTTYIAANQAELLGTASPLGAYLVIEVGFISARLLISKLNPDGKED